MLALVVTQGFTFYIQPPVFLLFTSMHMTLLAHPTLRYSTV